MDTIDLQHTAGSGARRRQSNRSSPEWLRARRAGVEAVCRRATWRGDEMRNSDRSHPARERRTERCDGRFFWTRRWR